MAILSLNSTIISTKLQHSLCQSKYRELIKIIKDQLPAEPVKDLINEIENYRGPLDKLKNQSSFKRKVDNMKKILWE